MSSNCAICDLESAETSIEVFRDDLWAAGVMPGYDVPGWFFLRARRHAERIGGLDEAEAETFGSRAKDMVAAVGRATGAEATYMLMFGETFAHFHVLIISRGADVPTDRRGGDILKLRAEQSDPDAARALVPAVRAAYADITAPNLAAVSSAAADGE